MTDQLDFYPTHSPMTDPGKYGSLYDDLPDAPASLIAVVHNVLIHKYTADDTLQLSSQQRKEKYLRTMQQRLEQIVSLDPSSLMVAREPKHKQVAYCRDFAVFLVSILRHKKIPARLRVGFEEYFVHSPQYRGDHWVTEYWDETESRWHMIDSDVGGVDILELERKVRAPLKKELDFTDIRLGQDFHTAPRAWIMCRSGQEKSTLFRVNRRWRGWPVLRGNLLHDFQALNRLEMGLFDYWDELHYKPESQMTTRDRSLLDQIAALCVDPSETFEAMRALFEALPRTRLVRSRLHLMGLLDGKDSQTASDLLESDFSRLVELTDAPGTAAPFNDEPKPVSELPREDGLPEDMQDFDGIIVQGARQNNLKNINVRIPRNKFVVITGVSGSGKSSLAFDTIYAEGQRRYVESLSRFARQFMKQMDKPQVDKITGLNPAVAIEQNKFFPDSRSTVGSITEVIDYIRLLFARLGRMHCPQCGHAVEPTSPHQIARRLVKLPPGTCLRITAPMNRYGSSSTREVLVQVRQDGLTQVRLDGELTNLEKATDLVQDNKEHTIEGLVMEVTVPPQINHQQQQRFYQQVYEAAVRTFELGQEVIHLLIDDEELRLSGERLCPVCNLDLPKLEPQLLNANTIHGMCLECNGLGVKYQVDPDLIVTKPHRSLMDDASKFRLIGQLRKSSSTFWTTYMKGIADYYNADLEKPWNELPEDFRRTLIYGSEGKNIPIEFGAESESGSFNISRNRPLDGAIHHINRLYRQTKSESSRRYYQQFMRQQPCPLCNGERINKEARFVSLAGSRFPEIVTMNIGELLTWVRGLSAKLDERQSLIGSELLAEVETRLKFICDVGLHYLSLDRPANTLSGGEAQRIRLASQIGTELVGVLYVLDEPSIGLHPRDQQALLDLLCHLRDHGNTVLVVEHDADAMRRADWIIDMGPGAGAQGGEISAVGTPAAVMANPASLTGAYLSGNRQVLSRKGDGQHKPQGWLALRGARLHNLKSLEARFPLGMFTCMTGVSGSGKSSLVIQTLYPALSQKLHRGRAVPGPFDELLGAEQLKRVVHITQMPIGRNPRSNPGTYVGILDEVRRLFAATEQAQVMGYPEGYFSFNTKGGRCEACEGYGANEIKMHFMANVWVRCPECEGKRFMPHILEVHYQDKNIAEVLEMDVSTAYEFFGTHPKIRQMLQTMLDVGLGYIRLGQSATTLSGGEAQRIKLAKELSRNGSGNTLYILDEPTTGLHFADIGNLLSILNRLVDGGNTVVVIEHNLEVIKAADWVIDMGPEGGEDGGYIIAQGSPEQVTREPESYTGRYLKEALAWDMEHC